MRQLLTLLLFLLTAACGDDMINTYGNPPVPPLPPRNRLVVLFGNSQSIGVSLASTASDPTIQNPFPTVQLLESYYGVSGPMFTPYAQRDLAPRPFALGGSYVIGTAAGELSMGRALVAGSTDNWSIAKMGADGAPMAGFWNETVTSPHIRDTFIAFIQTAITTFGVTSASDVFLAAFVGILDDGSTYQATLTNFYGYMRAAIPGIRDVMDQTAINPGVEAAIVSFTAGDGGNTKIVPSSDLPVIGGGNNHYPMDSYVTWGQRCAAQILSFP